MVLLAGTSGLSCGVAERKRGAGESYQQIAENAAANGFNRILGTLNNDAPGEYLGYLYRLNGNNPNGSSWENIPQLEEPCAAKSSTIPPWLLSRVDLQNNTSPLRSDKQGDLKSSFRLRKYIGPIQGKSSAQFEVEGFVNKDGSENDYEARSLLIRSLYINSEVPTPDDWAVLAARDYILGNTKIEAEEKYYGQCQASVISQILIAVTRATYLAPSVQKMVVKLILRIEYGLSST